LSQVINQKYGTTIERLVKEDLLERSGENVRLTRRGLLFAIRCSKNSSERR